MAGAGLPQHPQILLNPIYAGAYAFGRRGDRTSVVEGRARKTSGHRRARSAWNVLIRDHHEAYLTWAEFEENQVLLRENAHMQTRAERKAARGGRALLTGLARCGQCGRMMRVFYGSRSGHAHRYQCRGDDAHVLEARTGSPTSLSERRPTIVRSAAPSSFAGAFGT